MEEKIKTAVLVLQYDDSNTYGQTASERVRRSIRQQKGIVELMPSIFIIDYEKEFQFVTNLVISEDRMFAGGAHDRHVHFVLIPCQSPVVGGLTTELKTKLERLGLKCWEIGYPEEPREGGK